MSTSTTSDAPDNPLTILTTLRLILRTTIDADILVLHERIFGDPDVMRFTFGGEPMSPERSEGFIRKFFTFGPDLTGIATLTDKASGDVIGFAGLFACDVLGADDLEIGFVLARHVWGNGIATEIGRAQLAFGFEQLGCGRLLGLVHPGNAASIHALTKLGMRYLTEVTNAKRPPRSVYVIDAATWQAQR